jgi:hypothetical protein
MSYGPTGSAVSGIDGLIMRIHQQVPEKVVKSELVLQFALWMATFPDLNSN